MIVYGKYFGTIYVIMYFTNNGIPINKIRYRIVLLLNFFCKFRKILTYTDMCQCQDCDTLNGIKTGKLNGSNCNEDAKIVTLKTSSD